jgi:hypothetical protein
MIKFTGMKASELRIGNNAYLKLETLQESVVTVTITDLVMLSEGKKHLNPIPLTEEWLLKFGFEKGYEELTLHLNDGKHGYLGGKIEYIPKTHQCSSWSGLGSWDDYGFISNIEYVHQLQNLYFALTGEELTPKLESSSPNE